MLERDGVVQCNSPKNQMRLYRLLCQKGQRWSASIVGYNTGRGLNLNPWSGGRRGPARYDSQKSTLKKYALWIKQKRLLWKDIDQHALEWVMPPFYDAWDEDRPLYSIIECLQKGWNWDLGIKYNPINVAVLQSPVKEIVLWSHLVKYLRTLSLCFPVEVSSIVADFLCTQVNPRSRLRKKKDISKLEK